MIAERMQVAAASAMKMIIKLADMNLVQYMCYHGKETKSANWTTVSSLLPVGMGIILCLMVAYLWRLSA